MTAKQLYFNRLKYEWSSVIKAWKTAIDWVVWLYVIIPVSLVFGHHYLTVWHKQAVWAESILPQYIVILLFIFTSKGLVRTFVKEADQLFLLQHSHWLREIRLRGMLYSLLVIFLQTMTVMLILAPYLLHYQGFSSEQLIIFALVIFLLKPNALLAQQRIPLEGKFWPNALKRISIRLITVSILGTAFFFHAVPWFNLCLSGVLSSILLFQIFSKLNSFAMFRDDVAREIKHSNGKISILVGIAEQTGLTYLNLKKERRLFKKLKWFPKSGFPITKINQVNMLVELFSKTVLRNDAYVMMYIQLMLILGAAIILLPFWLKWGLWLLSYICLVYFISVVWKEMMRHPYLKTYPWKEKNIAKAYQKTVLYFLTPSFSLLGLLLGSLTFQWLGAVLLTLISVLLGVLMHRRHVIVR
ncbi:ABC-2 type transport system permease protein [Caldalkalibacillus uzonensis]|uniref:ABC-2 type transport system permease protein n=1 Tax=Caldalkalibacillus uzonensis TaxID=353224 RepID=A0ABU0CNA7_9BACI|nr:ABC transporter permease [Caldalkalibacillus uzonensis]MDQ0337369.1 ABC-2 type transport system permease protein [Caldalkalibacillus uzonensis]